MYRTILQIDDDPDDCELFEKALHEVSRIDYAAMKNPVQALAYLVSGTIKPDLIILDLNMPGIDGFAMLDTLRLEMASNNIPIIVYSTSSSPECRQNALRRGAKDYFTKPDNYDKLKKVVEKVINSHPSLK